MFGARVLRVPGPEVFRFEAVGARLVSYVVVGTTAHECHLAGHEFHRAAGVVEPQPSSAPDDGVHGQLDRASQSQPPRRLGHRPGEDGAGGPRPRKVILQYVHAISISTATVIGKDSSV